MKDKENIRSIKTKKDLAHMEEKLTQFVKNSKPQNKTKTWRLEAAREGHIPHTVGKKHAYQRLNMEQNCPSNMSEK